MLLPLDVEKTRVLQLGNAPAQESMVRELYAQREAVVSTYQIDSAGLTLDPMRDLSHRVMRTTGHQDYGTNYAAAATIPDCTMVLPRGVTKAAALAAIDAIRVVVAASALP